MKSYSFADLFAGCGGLSLGLSQAGLKGKFAIERDPMAFGTFSANFIEKPAAGHAFEWPKYAIDACSERTRSAYFARNVEWDGKAIANAMRMARGQNGAVSCGHGQDARDSCPGKAQLRAVARPSDGIARPQIAIDIIGGPAIWVIVDLHWDDARIAQIYMLGQREIIKTQVTCDIGQDFTKRIQGGYIRHRRGKSVQQSQSSHDIFSIARAFPTRGSYASPFFVGRPASWSHTIGKAW